MICVSASVVASSHFFSFSYIVSASAVNSNNPFLFPAIWSRVSIALVIMLLGYWEI